MSSIFKQRSVYIAAALTLITQHEHRRHSGRERGQHTNKHFQSARLTKSTWVCALTAGVCAGSLIKEAIIGDNWSEVLLLTSSSSAHRPQSHLFLRSFTLYESLLSPVPRDQPPSPTILRSLSAQMAAFQHR